MYLFYVNLPTIQPRHNPTIRRVCRAVGHVVQWRFDRNPSHLRGLARRDFLKKIFRRSTMGDLPHAGAFRGRAALLTTARARRSSGRRWSRRDSEPVLAPKVRTISCRSSSVRLAAELWFGTPKRRFQQGAPRSTPAQKKLDMLSNFLAEPKNIALTDT